ncbi:MAG TPA: nuclear transport factor 2 family protein [Vicinamibacterales bacterium]|nr:nuclear transport factor 2 family protein [Vicinamibacterales bacterium]
MSTSRSYVCTALMLLTTVVSLTAAEVPVGPLTDKDVAEIRQLSVTYRRALLTCHGEEYADLFATPGGYFSSGPRGEVRERAQLIEMVVGYDRCKQKPAAEPGTGGAPRVPATPPVIEWAPEGAKARIVNSRGGGYYDDVYVRTPHGWRFKSRNVIADNELAAKLTTKDFVDVRELAGDDHGHYDNVYGEYGDERNYTPRTGPDDTRPFRSSGLRLVPTADGGMRGVAFLRNNGGRYDDLYVRTPDGWRIKQRVYTPPGGTPPAAK